MKQALMMVMALMLAGLAGRAWAESLTARYADMEAVWKAQYAEAKAESEKQTNEFYLRCAVAYLESGDLPEFKADFYAEVKRVEASQEAYPYSALALDAIKNAYPQPDTPRWSEGLARWWKFIGVTGSIDEDNCDKADE